MIDVHELLQMKENQLVRVRKEIQALHLVAQMLSESDEAEAFQPADVSTSASVPVEGNVAADNPPQDEPSSESIPAKRSRFRGFLGLAAGE